MQIKSLAQGENILMLGFEPSTSVSQIDILTTRPICSSALLKLLSELLYGDDFVLMSETIEGLMNKFIKL